MSSAAAITPFHFDPEVNFFAQIEGEKIYHVYAPDVVPEPELEHFYVRNLINIGEVRLNERDRSAEHVFPLVPGRGLHQPQNSPHWVETKAARSISYSMVFETPSTRAHCRTRSFNYYLRRAGMRPAPVGRRPVLDDAKARAMTALLPIRRGVGSTLRALSGPA